MEDIRLDSAEARKSKKNSFEDLHDSSKRLILNASSSNGESTPDSICNYAKMFFNIKSVGKASDYLATTLAQDFKCCVQISTVLVTALCDGNFLRDKEDSPGNFSFFMVPRKKPLAYSNRRANMILQLKISQGKGWDEIDYKEAIKQGIETPEDIPSLIFQLQNLCGLAAFFFGTSSLLPLAIGGLLEKLNQHVITFEGFQIRDNEFATKIGYAIDTRIFRWLQQCQINEDRELIDDKLINFDSLVSQVLTDSFFQVLPITFKSTNHDESTTNSNQKRKGDFNDDKGKNKNRKIQNSKPINEWLVADAQEYKTKFAGKIYQTDLSY